MLGEGKGVHARGNLTAEKERKQTPQSTSGFAENSAAIESFNGAKPVFELPYWEGVELQVDPLDRFDMIVCTIMIFGPANYQNLNFV
jgi:hypothetical protein